MGDDAFRAYLSRCSASSREARRPWHPASVTRSPRYINPTSLQRFCRNQQEQTAITPRSICPIRSRRVDLILVLLLATCTLPSVTWRRRERSEMSSVCARPVGVGYLVGGAASSWSQRRGRGVAAPRARVRVSASASTVAPERRAATMYEVLAVERPRAPRRSKAAYRRARGGGTGRVPGGAERFMLAREAYEVLSDPERRRGYDIQLRCCGAGAGAQAARRPGSPTGRRSSPGSSGGPRRGRRGGAGCATVSRLRPEPRIAEFAVAFLNFEFLLSFLFFFHFFSLFCSLPWDVYIPYGVLGYDL